jgi:hypothetical protein
MEIHVDGLGRIPPEVRGMAARKPESVLDMRRMQGPDARDPRFLGEGPCGRHHKSYRQGSNAWGEWKFCSKCGLRFLYVPYEHAPGNSTEVLEPELVQRALLVMRKYDVWEDMTSTVMRRVVDILKKNKNLDLSSDIWLALVVKKKGAGQGQPPRATVQMVPATGVSHEASCITEKTDLNPESHAVGDETEQIRRELRELKAAVELLRRDRRSEDSSPSVSRTHVPEEASR